MYTIDWAQKVLDDKEYPAERFLRVKYLDYSDIQEVLGSPPDNRDTQEVVFKIPLKKGFGHHEITFFTDENRLHIEEYYQSKMCGSDIGQRANHTLFNGYVKNKSQLIILIKQLGIQ